jgi:hypothetical protein
VTIVPGFNWRWKYKQHNLTLHWCNALLFGEVIPKALDEGIQWFKFLMSQCTGALIEGRNSRYIIWWFSNSWFSSDVIDASIRRIISLALLASSEIEGFQNTFYLINLTIYFDYSFQNYHSFKNRGKEVEK